MRISSILLLIVIVAIYCGSTKASVIPLGLGSSPHYDLWNQQQAYGKYSVSLHSWDDGSYKPSPTNSEADENAAANAQEAINQAIVRAQVAADAAAVRMQAAVDAAQAAKDQALDSITDGQATSNTAVFTNALDVANAKVVETEVAAANSATSANVQAVISDQNIVNAKADSAISSGIDLANTLDVANVLDITNVQEAETEAAAINSVTPANRQAMISQQDIVKAKSDPAVSSGIDLAKAELVANPSVTATNSPTSANVQSVINDQEIVNANAVPTASRGIFLANTVDVANSLDIANEEVAETEVTATNSATSANVQSVITSQDSPNSKAPPVDSIGIVLANTLDVTNTQAAETEVAATNLATSANLQAVITPQDILIYKAATTAASGIFLAVIPAIPFVYRAHGSHVNVAKSAIETSSAGSTGSAIEETISSGGGANIVTVSSDGGAAADLVSDGSGGALIGVSQGRDGKDGKGACKTYPVTVHAWSAPITINHINW